MSMAEVALILNEMDDADIGQKMDIYVVAQNVTQDSVDIAFKTSSNIGRLLNQAYGLNTPALEELYTWNDVIESEVALAAISRSEVAFMTLMTSKVTKDIMLSPTTINIIINSNDVMRNICAFSDEGSYFVMANNILWEAIRNSGTALSALIHSEIFRRSIINLRDVMTTISNSSIAVSAVCKSSRVLNLITKSSCSDIFVASPYISNNIANISDACKDTAYFTRQGVYMAAHSDTATFAYHNIAIGHYSNSWSTTRSESIHKNGLYIIKSMQICSTSSTSYYGSIYSASSNNSLIELATASGTYDAIPINKIAMGSMAIGGSRGIVTPSWNPNGTTPAGEAFLAI